MDSFSGIDRTSPLPFYHQLKQLLVQDIETRGLQPGDRVPGDFELCERYGVSRTVVRQALNELDVEGVIERRKGRGTFVAARKTSERLVQSLTGLFEDVQARGSQLRSQVRRMDVVPASAAAAEDLQVPVGAPIVEIERLRFVDDLPWVLTITQLSESVGRPLLNEDLRETSLYGLLEDKYGVRLVKGRRTVEASSATAYLATALGVPEGAPVLVLRNVSIGEAGVPVERFVAFHRGDRSRFEVELYRSPGGARAVMVIP